MVEHDPRSYDMSQLSLFTSCPASLDNEIVKLELYLAAHD